MFSSIPSSISFIFLSFYLYTSYPQKMEKVINSDKATKSTVSDIKKSIENVDSESLKSTASDIKKSIENVDSEETSASDIEKSIEKISKTFDTMSSENINKVYVIYIKSKLTKNNLEEIESNKYKIKSKTTTNFFKSILNSKITDEKTSVSAKIYTSDKDIILLFDDNTNWSLNNRNFSKNTSEKIDNIKKTFSQKGIITLNDTNIYYST